MLVSLGVMFVLAVGMALTDLHQVKAIQKGPPLRGLYDTVHVVPLETLQAARRQEVLRLLNSAMCVCECKLTLAQCRNVDRTCRRSLDLALEVLNAPPH